MFGKRDLSKRIEDLETRLKEQEDKLSRSEESLQTVNKRIMGAITTLNDILLYQSHYSYEQNEMILFLVRTMTGLQEDFISLLDVIGQQEMRIIATETTHQYIADAMNSGHDSGYVLELPSFVSSSKEGKPN